MSVSIQESGGRERVGDCLRGFYAPNLGWELLTKAEGEMVERRHSLAGRCIWGVWVLLGIAWWRGS